MQTPSQEQERVLGQCRREALSETWKGSAGVVVFIALAAMALVVMEPATDFGQVALAWLVIGAVGNEAGGCVVSAVSAWRAVGRMRRDPEYLAAMVAVEAAEARAEYVALGSRG
ncbi:hypothetical protein GCM10009613_65890 [Pseudonocardia kongjuensis]|uniref:Uncharacterized protein n=1 Tax=Pseudonocardia kongjuensis TaxID=102227 RepID=A0ABN1YCI5_9PSEU